MSDDSGQAFPTVGDSQTFGASGMTKRLWLAGQALPAVIAAEVEIAKQDSRILSHERIADNAIACADTLLARMASSEVAP